MNDSTTIVAPTIAREIREHHEAAHTAARSALEHARRAGELLIEAKANIDHGQWLPWVAEHLPMISETTIRGYMRVASRWAEIQTGNGVADLPLRDALKLLAEPKAKTAVAAPTDDHDTERALRKLRDDVARSRKAEHRASRILEITVGQATFLCDDVTNDTGQIDTELLALTEPALRLVWARELREAAARITRLAQALDRCGRG